MLTLFRFAFIPALLGCVFTAFSQAPRSIQNIGLNNVSVIELANNGDAWAGSLGQGVGFYDGTLHTWTYFNTVNTPQFHSDSVTAISFGAIGPNRLAIIGTVNGAIIRRENIFDTLGPLPNPYVTGISQLNNDTVWITTKGGVAAFDTTGAVVFLRSYTTGNSTIPSNQLTAINRGGTQCPDGYLAGTTNKGGFYTADGNTYTVIDTSAPGKRLVDNRVNTVYVENNCMTRLFGTKGGFSMCPNGIDCQNFTTANGLPQNDIVSIAQGCNAANFWLATRDSGIVIFTPPSTFSRLNTSNGLPSNQVTAIAFAGCTGWIGTADGNISVVDSTHQVVGVISSVNNLNADVMKVHVYPQPAQSQVNFLFEKELSNSNFTLSDISGKQVAAIALQNTTSLNLDVSALQQGFYFYTIYSGRQMLKAGKVLVLK